MLSFKISLVFHNCVFYVFHLNTHSRVKDHSSTDTLQLTVLCLTFLSMEDSDIQLLPAFPYTHLLLVAVDTLDQFLHAITSKFK